MEIRCPDCRSVLPEGARACANCPWDPAMAPSQPEGSEPVSSRAALKKAAKPLIVVAILLGGMYFWKQREKMGSAGFDETMDVTAAIATAVDTGRRTGKRVFIEVGGDWCEWCHRLQAFLEADAEIKEFLATRYVMVKFNVSDKRPNSVPLRRFPKVPGYPHFFILDEEGKLLVSQISDDFEAPGETYDHEKVLAFLRQWAKPR